MIKIIQWSSEMNFVHSAFQDADVLVYMVEIGEKDLKDEKFFEKILSNYMHKP